MKTAVVLTVLFITLASSKKAVIEDDEDMIIDDALIDSRGSIRNKDKMNGAPLVKTHKVDTYSLEHRFTGDDSWTERGSIEVSRDSNGRALSIKIVNNPLGEGMKGKFEQAC